MRRQHTVSRFYLAGFAAEGRTLVRVPLADPSSAHSVGVSDATVVKDFYSLDRGDGELDDFFEHAFGEVEGAAAPALRRALDPASRWPLDKDDKAVLALWIALQHLRSESIRTIRTNIDALVIRLVVGTSGKAALRRHIEESEGAAISDDRLDAEWQDLTQTGGTEMSDDVAGHLASIAQMLSPTAHMLYDEQWSLDCFERKALVTSDHPVVLLPRPGAARWEGIGLATAGGFAVPLDRRSALVIGASPDLPDMRVPGNAALANRVNAGVAANARRAIYHHPDDREVLRGLRLPPARSYEIDPRTGEDMVKEAGLFAGLSAEQLRAFQGPEDRNRDGFSLSDLTWPIPGRRFRWQPHGGAPAGHE